MLIILSTKPVLSISVTLIWPLANTMALGGVPIGSMLAQLAPNVIGIPSTNGSKFIETAREVITGANTITWATLLISSLKNTERVVTISIIKNTFSIENEAIYLPN